MRADENHTSQVQTIQFEHLDHKGYHFSYRT